MEERSTDYIVSARRFRPQTFSEVIGQAHVVRTLTNAVKSGRLAQAYLFSGPKGVGKTTVARILAKVLNCPEGNSGAPCNQCDLCREMTAGASPDVTEIDGASNRGIDEIRELRENVRYMPMRGKRRVIIIDEVHMLTEPAFNALLKTLEEPPPHLLFIFATTEAHKIPGTILSRCQQFTFRRIPYTDILDRLSAAAKMDDLGLSIRSLSLIGRAAEGSLRDAFSLLDQAVAFGGREVSEEDVALLLGGVDLSLFFELTESLAAQDAPAALFAVRKAIGGGADLRYFCREWLTHLRNLLVAKSLSQPHELIDLPSEDVERLIAAAQKFSEEDLLRLFTLFSKVSEEVRFSFNPALALEVGLLKATRLARLAPLEEILRRLCEMESSPPTSEKRPDPKREREAAVTPDRWPQILAATARRNASVAGYLKYGCMRRSADEVIIDMTGDGELFSDVLQRPENASVVSSAVEEVLGKARIRWIPKSALPAALLLPDSRREPDPTVQEVLKIFEGKISDPGEGEA